jgi:serine/threonine-protein kinase
VTDALQVRTFQSAVSAYERALDAEANHTRSRRGLARLYWAELQRARRRGNSLDEIAFEQLLREVDDGEFVQQLQRDGVLEVSIGDFAGRVSLAKLVERDRRLVEGSVETIADRPQHRRMLPAGRYVVSAAIGEGQLTAWPISLEPGGACKVVIEAPSEPLGQNEVLIPGGITRLGGDALSTETDEPIIVDVPTFILQRYPVTFEQWFEFLDALRAQDPDLVGAHLPRTTLGMPTWQRAGSGNWVPDASVPSIQVPLDPQRFPVFGISAESAEVYAAWLSQKEGRTWRLPTELEWEKAGRGTDGRVYPWGDHFDATFCKMRDSRSGPPLAEPIGAFLWDVSPYGVCDLAGGVADWCIPDHRRTAVREPREVVSRGGAWCDWPIDCRLASRRRYLSTEHSARVGVRLARTIEEKHG